MTQNDKESKENDICTKAESSSLDDRTDTAMDPEPTQKSSRQRYFLTLCLYLCFVCLGLVESLTGPTLVHLAHLLHTDIAGISLRFTAGSVGYLAGSLLCGVTFDKYNYELQFSTCICLLSLSTTILPWLPNRVVFFACDFVVNLSSAFLDAACQPYIIGLWTGQKHKEPVVQGLHGVYTIGAVVGPFIAAPFLVNLQNIYVSSSAEDLHSNVLKGQNFTTDSSIGANMSYLENISELTYLASGENDNNGDISTEIETDDSCVEDSEDIFWTIEGVEKVRYCYAIVGGLVMLISILFSIAYCIVKSPVKRKLPEKDKKRDRNQTKCDAKFKLIILILQFFFVMFYYWCEEIPANLLSAYAFEGLHWDVSRATLLMSVFWTSHGVGVLVGVFISAFTSPKNMLAFNLVATNIAFLLLFMVPYTADWLLWIAASLNAFATATTFASAMLWMSEFTKITGKIGSVFMSGISCGSITGSTVAAYLFETFSHEWVAYLCLAAAIIDCLLFVVMYIIVRSHKSNLVVEESKHLNGSETTKV